MSPIACGKILVMFCPQGHEIWEFDGFVYTRISVWCHTGFPFGVTRFSGTMNVIGAIYQKVVFYHLCLAPDSAAFEPNDGSFDASLWSNCYIKYPKRFN